MRSGCSLRVLCTSTGGAGHVNALAPLARALREAGHDVQWAVAPDGGDAVAAMGFRWHAAGLTGSARHDAVRSDVLAAARIPPERRRGPLFTAVFARAAAPVMYRELAPLVERMRPDVVIREMGELAAAPLAIARRIPLVTVAFSGALPEPAHAPVLAALTPLWRAEGLPDPQWWELVGDLYLHPFPPLFGQRPDAAVVRPMGASGAVARAEPPDWVLALGSTRPCLYVSSGTEPMSTTFPWREVVGALGRRAVDAIVTIGPHVDLDALGTVATNVRVERFVAQSWLLPHVSGVVSHAGAGTVLGAAASGRPQAVVPLWADQWENAMAVVAARCGVLVAPDHRTTDDIEAAIDEVLTSPTLAGAAARVATEIAAMPTPDQLVPDIEALANA